MSSGKGVKGEGPGCQKTGKEDRHNKTIKNDKVR